MSQILGKNPEKPFREIVESLGEKYSEEGKNWNIINEEDANDGDVNHAFYDPIVGDNQVSEENKGLPIEMAESFVDREINGDATYYHLDREENGDFDVYLIASYQWIAGEERIRMRFQRSQGILRGEDEYWKEFKSWFQNGLDYKMNDLGPSVERFVDEDGEVEEYLINPPLN